MSQSSILGGERAPQQARGRNAETLGPSDTSDSGSDIQGASRLKTDAEEGELGGATPVDADSDTDSMGTGERAAAVPEGARDGADIAPTGSRARRTRSTRPSRSPATTTRSSRSSTTAADDDDEDALRSVRRAAARRAAAPAGGRCRPSSRPATRPTISKPKPGSGSTARAPCSG